MELLFMTECRRCLCFDNIASNVTNRYNQYRIPVRNAHAAMVPWAWGIMGKDPDLLNQKNQRGIRLWKTH
jgi:hypothetical protein